MRKILIIGWLSCFCFLGVKAQVDLAVQLTIRDGASGTAKTAIERSLSALLTEINNAYIENRALNLVSLHMTDDARAGLTSMWENVHFYCDDAEVVQNCLRKGLSGYQIRQIPLMMRPTGSATTQDDEFQEGVVNLSESGQITRFNVALATNSYLSVISRGTNVTDTRRREEILSYVEHFRTAYEEKDLAFMNQIFSDDALIITGTVIRSKKTDGTITPGKMLDVTGNKIRSINADGTGLGTVRFLKADTREEVATVTEFGINDPKRLMFIAPTLDEGGYILQIETYFSNATTLLKQPRLIDYPVTLYVGERPSTGGGGEEEEERPGGL